jgi:hypothetical protein
LTYTPTSPASFLDDIVIYPHALVLNNSNSGGQIYDASHLDAACAATSKTWNTTINVITRILNPDGTPYLADIPVAIVPILNDKIQFGNRIALGALQVNNKIGDLTDVSTTTHSLHFEYNLNNGKGKVAFVMWPVDENGDYLDVGPLGNQCDVNRAYSPVVPGGGGDDSGAGADDAGADGAGADGGPGSGNGASGSNY